MKTQIKNQNCSYLRKTAAISLFLVIGYSSLAQQNIESAIKNGWWSTVLKKHNIDPGKYSYKTTFYMGTNDTIINQLLELGESDSLTNKIVNYKNAILFTYGADHTYTIYRSEFAQHDNENDILTMKNVYFVNYDFKNPKVVPLDSLYFHNVKVDIKKNSISFNTK